MNIGGLKLTTQGQAEVTPPDKDPPAEVPADTPTPGHEVTCGG